MLGLLYLLTVHHKNIWATKVMSPVLAGSNPGTCARTEILVDSSLKARNRTPRTGCVFASGKSPLRRQCSGGTGTTPWGPCILAPAPSDPPGSPWRPPQDGRRQGAGPSASPPSPRPPLCPASIGWDDSVLSTDWAIRRREVGGTGRWSQAGGARIWGSTLVSWECGELAACRRSWESRSLCWQWTSACSRQWRGGRGWGRARHGGCFEEGDTCVGIGRHGDAEGYPGGAGPVRRLGISTGCRAPKR